MNSLGTFIAAHPLVIALLSPVWGAVLIDLMAFSKSKDPGPFLQTFSWKIAFLRYLQAFIGGLVGNIAIATGASVVGIVIWRLW